MQNRHRRNLGGDFPTFAVENQDAQKDDVVQAALFIGIVLVTPHHLTAAGITLPNDRVTGCESYCLLGAYYAFLFHHPFCHRESLLPSNILLTEPLTAEF